MKSKVRTALGYVLGSFAGDGERLTDETIALARQEYEDLCAIRAAAENYAEKRSSHSLARLLVALERP